LQPLLRLLSSTSAPTSTLKNLTMFYTTTMTSLIKHPLINIVVLALAAWLPGYMLARLGVWPFVLLF
ncbi:hypothetical protein HK102_012101, partial [Quaeritorhiza haematococci]